MMRLFNYQPILIGILFLLLLGSCNNEDICLSNQHAAQIKLLSLYSTTDKDTTLKVSAWGLGRTDSVYSSQSLNNLFLPLKFDGATDTSEFVLKLNNTLDTIVVVHNNELDFVSGDCGYVFKIEVKEFWFTTNTIDSVVVSYPIIKYGQDAINIKLYIY